MKKFLGTLVVLLGVMMLVEFAIWGSVRAGAQAGKPHLLLPLLAAGMNYETLKFCAGLGCLILGLHTALRPPDAAPSPMAQVFLLNAVLLCGSLLLAFAGSHQPDPQFWTGLFTLTAALEVVVGLVLLVLAVSERPLDAVGITLGGVVYVASVAIAAVAYLGASG
jgi:hypothetical protein